MSDDIDRKLTESDLPTLLNTLTPIASKCVAFGLQLGVEQWRVSNIKHDDSKCADQLQQILVVRLNQEKPLTWRDIVTALKSRSVREDKVAWGIEHHCLRHEQLHQNVQGQATGVTSQCYTTHSTPHFPSLTTTTSIPASREDSQYRATSRPDRTSFFLTSSDSVTNPSHSLTMTQRAQAQAFIPEGHQGSFPPPSGRLVAPQYHTPCQYVPHPTFHHSQPHGYYQRGPWHQSQYPFNPNQPGTANVYTPQSLTPSYQGASQPPSQYVPQFHPPPQQSVILHHNYPPHIPQPPSSIPDPHVYQSHPQRHDSPPPMASSVVMGQLAIQYIDYVKTVYRNSEVERDTRTVKWPPTPSKKYINLVSIDRSESCGGKEYDEVTKYMVQNGDIDVVRGKKWPIHFKKIAAGIPDTGDNRLVLVEGAPGVGKSTFALEYCRRWMRGEIAQPYTLVLLFRLRDERMARAKTLRDLICHASEEVRQAIIDDLIRCNGSKTLIILEGFDELPDACRKKESIFLQLICGELLPLATVMVTSRPWATRMFLYRYKHRIFQRIEILGFTAQQISEYIESVLPNNEESKDLQLYVERHPQIRGCMYIPLNSAIVVTVYQESQSSGCPMPTTLTGLYTALARVLLVRHLHGQPAGVKRDSTIGVFSDLRVPHEVERNFTELCKLAYNGIVNQRYKVQLIFKDSDLPANFDNLGFMDSVTELYVTRGTVSSHNFLHLTFQEFFAAVHISTLSPAQQLEYFNRSREGSLKVVLRFLAGITKLSCLSYEEKILISKFEPNIYNLSLEANFEIDVNVINWMFEAQVDNVIELLNIKESNLEFQILDTSNLTVGFRDNYQMLPMDYYSLGYCIANSQCQWLLEFTDITKEKINMLVVGAHEKPNTHGKVVGLSLDYKSPSVFNLNCLFNGLGNIIVNLEELHLKHVFKKYSDIVWPNLSSLKSLILVLCEVNSRLDVLSPSLNLKYLELNIMIRLSYYDCVAVANYLINSTTLKDFKLFRENNGNADMEIITKALSANPQSLNNLTLGPFWFTDTAVYYLAEFITKSTTLQRLELKRSCISINGVRITANALHNNNSLQEKKNLNLKICLYNAGIGGKVLVLCEMNSILDVLSPSLNLKYLELNIVTELSYYDCAAVASYLINSTTLKDFKLFRENNGNADMEIIIKALSANPQSLNNLTLGPFWFTDTAIDYLAEFITKSTTLQRLEFKGSYINLNGVRIMANALHSNTSLQEKNINLHIRLYNDGIGEENLDELFNEYPDMERWCEVVKYT